jgi:hypothetical protein
MSSESLTSVLALVTLVIPVFGGSIFLYRYQLDRIPGLTMFQAIIFLIVFRLIDGATFLWAAGGQFLDAEMNLVYRQLVGLLPHSWAFGLNFLAGTVGFLLVLPLLRRVLLHWGTPAEVYQFNLTLVATFSVMSLVGAVTNVAFALLGYNSPFLVG